MQEVFEKIRATDVDIIVESPKNNKHDGQQPYYCIRYYDLADKQVHIGFGSYCLDYVLQWKEECFEIVDNINQVAEEYRTTMGQVKCDTSFSDGYIKAIDDAIEKFLEYGCFLVEWNPKLSKENLVTDVLRQVKGQAVYKLEKMKQKEIDSVNQVAEEYKSLLTDTDLVKALRCLGSQTVDGDCYETLYNMQHMGDEDYKPMRCGACESETKICCPYHQKTYDVCFEDGDCWWLREVADMIELIAGTNVSGNAFNIIYNKVCKLEQQYAKVEGNMEAVNDCIRLENLLQYFKEELREENNQSLTEINQSLTNDGWIPCSERLPKTGEIVLVHQTYSWEKFEDAAAVTIGRLRPGERQYWEFQYYRPDFQKGAIMDNDIICPGSEYVIAWQPLPEPYKPEGE